MSLPKAEFYEFHHETRYDWYLNPINTEIEVSEGFLIDDANGERIEMYRVRHGWPTRDAAASEEEC